jgi:hypothetical protein
MLGKDYRLGTLEPPERDHLEKLGDLIEANGFKVAIGG